MAAFAPILVAFASLTAVAPTLAQVTETRSSSFGYDLTTTGLLTSEVIEKPETPDLCVQTVHVPDIYGNRGESNINNCSGASGRAVFQQRKTTVTFSQFSISLPKDATGTTVSVTVLAGTFPRTTTITVNDENTVNPRTTALQTQTETRTFDPRFGVVTRLTGPNGQNTDITYDDFGRKTREKAINDTFTDIAYCIIGSELDNSSNTPSVTGTGTTSVAGCDQLLQLNPQPPAPNDAVQFVHSTPRDTAGAKMGPYARVYLDRLGREIRTVTESFDGNGQNAGLIVKDVVYDLLGAKIAETAPYFHASGQPQHESSTLANPAAFGRTITEYDLLGRPTKVSTSDPTGTEALPQVNFLALNGRFTNVGGNAAVTRYVYSGLDVTVTNAKGQTLTQEKNPDGKIVRTTDSLGAQVAYRFDAFGNLVETLDGLGNRTTAEFDRRGRRTRMVDPNAGEWMYQYNALGEVRWQQSPKQRAQGAQVGTEMWYDTLGRMWKRSTQEFTSTFIYDRYRDGTACNRCLSKLTETVTDHGVARRFTFDTIGQLTQTRTTFSGGLNGGATRVYTASQTWDSVKRRPTSQTYPSGVRVNLQYTSGAGTRDLGFLWRQTNNTGGAMLWEAQRINALGGIEQQRFGNNVQTRAVYQAATGRVVSLDAGLGTASNVLSQTYGWDAVGNLTSRVDNNGPANGTGAVSEAFKYDAINRLYEYTVLHPAISGGARTVNVTYNAGGNILAKSDVGSYRYAPNGSARPSSDGPHSVLEVRPVGGGSIGYTYDANGNVASTTSANTVAGAAAKYTSIAYTSFNLPDSSAGLLGATGTRYTWQYDENHARVKETKVSAAGTRTTWSLHPDKAGGLAFEQEFAENGTVTNRNFLTAGGAVIGVLITQGDTWVNNAQVNRTTIVRTEYWHKDHLGSTAAVTDSAGAVTARYAYDPWGKRRFTNGTYDAFGTLVIEFTAGNADRGFTGHEHLDDVGIVHMNGRLYDANLGRFLQPDPYVQEILLLQNFNRYSYVLNNPLNATDPSGEFIPQLLFVAAAFIVAKHVPELRPFLAIAVAIVIGPAGPWAAFGNNLMANAAFAGFSAGAIGSGSFKGGVQGMFSGMVFAGIGEAFGTVTWSNPGEMAGAVAAHAAAGCAMQAVSGGNCRAGALSAAFAKSAAPLVPKDLVVGTVVSAVIGGTGSELGGGKFANGAVTGAFSYLLNQAAQDAKERTAGRAAINGLKVVGGGASVALGAKACVTGVGCGVGIALMTFGVAEVTEGVAYFAHPSMAEGFNPLRDAVFRPAFEMAGLDPTAGDLLYATAALGLSITSANMPVQSHFWTTYGTRSPMTTSSGYLPGVGSRWDDAFSLLPQSANRGSIVTSVAAKGFAVGNAGSGLVCRTERSGC